MEAIGNNLILTCCIDILYGRTTIIESMKYAVTGSLPPGKNAGQSFVHDPKSVGSSVVKASVRLRFTNRAGDSMVLIRSMELTQKKKSMTFKSLDGLLRSFDPTTGQKQSMSHKCSDLDKHIPMLLGVSKPVLEHVVFCHQEDSSWPLMDSAVLKKRFDDIFDSTRYAKALKSIAEIKKEYTSKVKEHKISVAEYKSHKHAAGGFQRELEKHLEDLESHQNKITKCRAFITKEEKTIGAKQAILDEGLDLQEEVMNKVTIKDNLEIVLKKQSEMLEEDLTKKHTHRELKDMQRDLDEKKESIKERKQDLEIVRDRLKEEIDLIRKEQIDIQGEIGKLQAEKEARQRLLKQRLVKMEDISQKHSIDLTLSQSQSSLTQNSMVTATQDGSVLSITDSEMKSFERNLEQKKAELVDKLKEEKARARAEEDRIQSSLNELEAKYRALEMSKSSGYNMPVRIALTQPNTQIAKKVPTKSKPPSKNFGI